MILLNFLARLICSTLHVSVIYDVVATTHVSSTRIVNDAPEHNCSPQFVQVIRVNVTLIWLTTRFVAYRVDADAQQARYM